VIIVVLKLIHYNITRVSLVV